MLFTQCSFAFFSVKYNKKTIFKKKKKIEKKNFFFQKTIVNPLRKKNTYGGKKPYGGTRPYRIYKSLIFLSVKKTGKKNIPV